MGKQRKLDLHRRRWWWTLAAGMTMMAATAGMMAPSYGASSEAEAAAATPTTTTAAVPTLQSNPMLDVLPPTVRPANRVLGSQVSDHVSADAQHDGSASVQAASRHDPVTAQHVHATHAAAHSSVTGHRASIRSNSASRSTASAPGASQTDLYWLAKVIEAEAGGEPLQAKIAVGDVVMNRVHSPLYPDSVKGVIFQIDHGHYAFTSVMNGWIYRVQPSADAWRAARMVLNQHVNVVPNALVFYNDAETPAGSWVRTRSTITTIGHFTFAR
ncbi:MAG: cell wall hydrolase [Thermoflavifilum sp.]|nr:cell wall hydrolase [Thermoflavifilum sp.]MCL6512875.1 cell wall hydrolase [Alicyclobacillus sp.]